MKEKKKRVGKYSIEEYTFDNTFMTGKEIEEMYATLKMHMFMKYGRYDEEVIHRTILRGLWKSAMYNPEKASKIVWFQSILRFIYIQEVDPSYNKQLKDLRLDDPGTRGEDDLDWHQVIGEEKVDEDEINRNKLVELIEELLEGNNYPILKMRKDGLTYEGIFKLTGMSNAAIYALLCEERLRIKKEISVLDSDELLINRSKFRDGSKSGRWARDLRKKINPRKCVVCEKEFIPDGKMIKFCGDNCRLRKASLQQKQYYKNKSIKKELEKEQSKINI